MGSDSEEQSDESALDQRSFDRRDALKKAATAAGVAGAAWIAPRVEGLSLQPEFAAAGTVQGTRGPFSRNFGPNSGTTTFNVPTTTPAGGTEPIVATYAGDSTNGNVNVSFNNMDPPFNSNCRILAISGNAPGGVGNVRFNAVNPTSASWDIYNPFWGNANTANVAQISFNITC